MRGVSFSSFSPSRRGWKVVHYLKGVDYRDWTHILEDQDSVYKLLQSKNRFQGEEDFMAIYNKHYEKLNIIYKLYLIIFT